MELRQFDFDYDQALEWIATHTDSKVFNKDKANPAKAKHEKEVDAPRTFFFPKSLHYPNSGKYYFAGWDPVLSSSCYIQGDMDGGGFLQPFWIAFALKQKENLEDFMKISELRFGYVNDKNERCSMAIIYNLLDPSKYMVSLLKNVDDPEFKNRKVNLFISDYFFKALEPVSAFNAKDIWPKLEMQLGSEPLKTDLRGVFTETGTVDLAKAEEFTKTQLRYWGAEQQRLIEQEKQEEQERKAAEERKALQDSIAAQERMVLQESRAINPVPVRHHFQRMVTPSTTPMALPRANEAVYAAVGASVGAALGWLIGALVIAPLLAPFTMGGSLILVVPFLLLVIGGLVGGGLGYSVAYGINHPHHQPEPMEMQNQVPEEPLASPRVSGTSYRRMSNRGLQQQTIEEEKKEDRRALSFSQASVGISVDASMASSLKRR